MELWPDHLTCPDLERWLPSELAAFEVRTVVAAPGGGWRLPGGLRRLANRWPAWSADEDPADVLLVFGPLSGELPDAEGALDSGFGRVVEVATIARPLRWWVRPWAWRSHAARAAALRTVTWARAGLYDIEQYVALAPTDAVVTLGELVKPKPRRSPTPS